MTRRRCAKTMWVMNQPMNYTLESSCLRLQFKEGSILKMNVKDKILEGKMEKRKVEKDRKSPYSCLEIFYLPLLFY